MKRITPLFTIALLLFFSCESPIKSNKKVIVEIGTEHVSKDTLKLEFKDSTTIIEDTVEITTEEIESPLITKDTLIGSWVGYFKKADEENYDKDIYADEGFYWQRQNKINISIDRINGNKVKGHSVVAGNNRPFEGEIKIDSSKKPIIYTFDVKEPGDDVYDGSFKFVITNNELIGKWVAFKKIDIRERKYTLKRNNFSYDSSIVLESITSYVDWTKSRTKLGEYEGWTKEDYEEVGAQEFATATDLIYEKNASSTLLTKEMVENWSKGDLKIIRNTIYARHGYSFKNRQLRVFFDAQPWYAPLHTDIRKELTEIEKKNIQLLLKYEKNAVEYYDYFGRG